MWAADKISIDENFSITDNRPVTGKTNTQHQVHFKYYSL
jgi:hypothetical protein